MFSRLSRKTLYRRFHAPYPRVPERALERLLGLERYNGESVVAVARDEIVGHVRRVSRRPRGRVAVVVEDSWQSKGVGKLLLSALAEQARQRGIESFTGTVLGENRRALDFFLAASSEVRCEPKDGTYLLRAPLSGGLESACGLARGRGREAVAAGTVARTISKGGS